MIGQLAKVDSVAPQRDRWLLSYADLLTLLLAFFVVMYSVSVVNEKKLHVLASSIESVMIGELDPSAEQLDEDLQQTGDQPQEASSLLSSIKIPNVEVKTEAGEWLEFTLASNFLFASGEAELKASIQETLDNVWLILERTEGDISVEGHTDNLAISTYRYPSNWELSAARAAALVRYFETQGVASTRLSATGMAASIPVANNNTVEGRELNRRVILKIRLIEGDLENIQRLEFTNNTVDGSEGASLSEQFFIEGDIDEADPNEIDLNDIDPEILMQILNEIEREN